MQQTITTEEFEAAGGDVNKIPAIRDKQAELDAQIRDTANQLFVGDTATVGNLTLHRPSMKHQWFISMACAVEPNIALHIAMAAYILSTPGEDLTREILPRYQSGSLPFDALEMVSSLDQQELEQAVDALMPGGNETGGK